MGVVRFDGNDDQLRFNTVAAALANISTGAYTLAVVCRRATTGVWTSAHTMLNASSGALGSINVNPSNQLVNDLVGGPGASTLLVDSTTETFILVVGKAAGTTTTQYSVYRTGTGQWQHQNSTGTSADQVAMAIYQIGAWTTGDFFNGWVGLVGSWAGNMSNTDRQALSANWRTSDWWNSVHARPVALIEGNKAAAEMTDLAGNATNLVVTGTTFDTAETLASWNFDGTGVVSPPQILRPDADLDADAWTTAPLFSKVNDQSDATVITATCA